ncbi:unnamed protein product [Ectocarpus sp. CCAP 1310/34]|nr:unnamed protein product [Ectocarpus sp. CCAP 1310/34]
MSSAGDEMPTAASGEEIRSPVEEGRDAELASLQRQISRLAALVEESMKKNEPGSVVADAVSWSAGLLPREANKNQRSSSAVAGDFSSSKREMVGKNHGSCWKVAGPADRERILRDQPEWARA